MSANLRTIINSNENWANAFCAETQVHQFVMSNFYWVDEPPLWLQELESYKGTESLITEAYKLNSWLETSNDDTDYDYEGEHGTEEWEDYVANEKAMYSRKISHLIDLIKTFIYRNPFMTQDEYENFVETEWEKVEDTGKMKSDILVANTICCIDPLSDDHVNALYESIKQDGWNGDPLVYWSAEENYIRRNKKDCTSFVYPDEEVPVPTLGIVFITGAHRRAALEKLLSEGIIIDVPIIHAAGMLDNVEPELKEYYSELIRKKDLEQLSQTFSDLGFDV